MNATPISSPDLLQGQNTDSDTDSNPDDSPEYYQPISSVDDRDGLDEDSDQANSDGEHQEEIDSHSKPNGYCEEHEAAYGISSVHLNDEEKSGIDDEEEEVEQERMGEAEMLRAFREDESRRNAPLPSENAGRVMEAMRGISFTGSAPDWAGRVPEDQWVDQIRSRRNAPLPSENATRVVEAMRGISFTGLAPDWAGRVPEDQWVDQIRSGRRRQQPST